jgi:hypothetical protein
VQGRRLVFTRRRPDFDRALVLRSSGNSNKQ